jgi:hypothetical protein
MTIKVKWPFVKRKTYETLLNEYESISDTYWRQASFIARADSRFKALLAEEKAMKEQAKK